MFSSFANVDDIIDEMYAKINNKILDKVFISKDCLKKGFIDVDKKYDIDLKNVSNFSALNKNMQSKLIRKPGFERSDLNHNEFDLYENNCFNKSHYIDDYNFDEKTPLILGGTYESMKDLVSALPKEAKDKTVFVLVSDRPFFPEDFRSGNSVDMMHKLLCLKNKKYCNKKDEISYIFQNYIDNQKTHPLMRKVIFYAKIISLINKSSGQKLMNMSKKAEDYFDREKKLKGQKVVVEIRKFLYEDCIKYLMTELDLAKYILKEAGVKKQIIIEAKTKFKTQDRATTIDTYYELEKYLINQKIEKINFVLVGLDTFVHRQWLQFAFIIKNKKIRDASDFVALRGKPRNNLVYVDDFARTFFVLNTEISHNSQI